MLVGLYLVSKNEKKKEKKEKEKKEKNKKKGGKKGIESNKAVSYGLRFFLLIFHSRTPTRKDPSFQNQEKSREPLQNPNQLGQQLEILKSKKIEKS